MRASTLAGLMRMKIRYKCLAVPSTKLVISERQSSQNKSEQHDAMKWVANKGRRNRRAPNRHEKEEAMHVAGRKPIIL